MSAQAVHDGESPRRKRTEPEEAREDAAEQAPAKLPAGAAGHGGAEEPGEEPVRGDAQQNGGSAERRDSEEDVLDGAEADAVEWQPDRATLQDPTGLLWFLAHGLGKIASASSARVGEDGFVEVALDEMMVARSIYRFLRAMLKLMGKHPIADERQHNIFFYLYRLCLSVLHSAPGDMSAGILRHGLSALSRCSEDGQSGALRLTWLRDSRVQVGVLPSGTAVRPAGGGGGGDGSDGSEGGGGDAGPAPRLTITALHPRRLVAAANVAQTMQAWTWPPTLRAWAPGEWPPWMPNPPTPQEVAMHEGLPPLPGLRVALHGPALKNHASVDDRRDADQDADSAYTRPPPASEEEAGQEQGGGARSESSRRRALYKELEELLHEPTGYEVLRLEKFRTNQRVLHYCEHATKEACMLARQSVRPCPHVHFVKVVERHTDPSLGDCSYLDTCRHFRKCRFVHYKVDSADYKAAQLAHLRAEQSLVHRAIQSHKYGAQWINCDVRTFDVTVLGKFDVIMADPPWDIHMDLPYGTMKDDEMRALPVKEMCDDGVIFLWVTGRTMGLGRELLALWGYRRVDELLWVKTNQLRRLICTGRTGHWLNHTKEHCLIGVKGEPRLNLNVDCDVLVSEIRETSRKPDEIYPLIERVCSEGRRLEIFAREHNLRPGWVSLGNQLPYSTILDPHIIERFNKRYPTHPYVPPEEARRRHMEQLRREQEAREEAELAANAPDEG